MSKTAKPTKSSPKRKMVTVGRPREILAPRPRVGSRRSVVRRIVRRPQPAPSGAGRRRFPQILEITKRNPALLGPGGLIWRKRVGVEPTRPGRAATPTDLKSARATGPHALPRRIMSVDPAPGARGSHKQLASRRAPSRRTAAQEAPRALAAPARGASAAPLAPPPVASLKRGAATR